MEDLSHAWSTEAGGNKVPPRIQGHLGLLASSAPLSELGLRFMAPDVKSSTECNDGCVQSHFPGLQSMAFAKGLGRSTVWSRGAQQRIKLCRLRI